MYKTTRRKNVATALAIGFVLGVVGLAQSPTLAAGSPCATAVIDEPFLLPDGSEHPAAELRICVRGEYSPIASFHETYVDGMPVGLTISRRTTSRGSDARNSVVVFDRLADGRLSLLGYAMVRRDGLEIYALQHPTTRRSEALERMALTLNDADPSIVLVAAR